MLNLHIDAADTLFFRDGRPFTMGEDTHVESVTFPPMPSVIYGALRTAFMSQNAHRFSLKTMIGLSDDLTVKCIALRDSGDVPFFVMPKDLVVPKNVENEAERLTLSSDTDSNLISSLTTERFLYRVSSDKIQEDDFIMSDSTLQDYLDGAKPPFSVCPLKDYLKTEVKLGIGRNNDTRISSDGMLYRIGMIRPQTGEKSIGIVVTFDNLDVSENALLQLGGEKKVAFTKLVNEPLSINCPKIDSTDFKIYLATPAIFKSGWKPNDLLKEYDLELITAAIGKSMNVGGWNVESGEPKPMLKAVPAGSVYYVRAKTQEDAQKAATAISQQGAISDYPNSAKQGFGIAFIGKI